MVVRLLSVAFKNVALRSVGCAGDRLATIINLAQAQTLGVSGRARDEPALALALQCQGVFGGRQTRSALKSCSGSA